MDYESFSYGFGANEGLDVDIDIEYEPFSFDPIIIDLLFESHKFNFVESKTMSLTILI